MTHNSWQITDSRGNPVYRKEDANKGKFAFTSDSYDVYEICFSSVVHGKPGMVRQENRRVAQLCFHLHGPAFCIVYVL